MAKGLLGAAAVAVVAAVVVLVAMRPEPSQELRLAHFVSPLHVVTDSIVNPLVEGVAADTDGALTIRVYPGGELGAGPADQYVRAMQGVADITWGLQGYTSSQFPRTLLTELPGVIPDGMSGYDLFWNAYDAHLSDEFPGTRPLALWTSEPAIIIMRDRVVRRPEDLAGMRVRVSGSIQGALVEALGATPVQMAAGDVYNALQTRLIDGLITGSSAILDFRLDEVATSYTLGAPLGQLAFFLVMNQARYDRLPEEFQAAIDAHSGIGLSRSGEEAWNARALDAIESVRANARNTVVDLSQEEAQAFADITLAFTERMVESLGAQQVLAAMRGE